MELAGNELKHPAWGIGAKDYLDALINGQHPLAEVYKMRSDGPDGSKADMVRATVLDYEGMLGGSCWKSIHPINPHQVPRPRNA